MEARRLLTLLPPLLPAEAEDEVQLFNAHPNKQDSPAEIRRPNVFMHQCMSSAEMKFVRQLFLLTFVAHTAAI